MENVKYFSLVFLLFCFSSSGEVLNYDLDDDNKMDSISLNNDVPSIKLKASLEERKLNILKLSDDDLISIDTKNLLNRLDIYDSSSSTPSYYVFSVKYNPKINKFTSDRFEYVIPCGHCNDLKTEYCSIYEKAIVSEIDFSKVIDKKPICYNSYENRSKSYYFKSLNDIVSAFDTNRQYMKSFSCNDLRYMVNQFSIKIPDSKISYKTILNFLRDEKEVELFNCLVKYLKVSEGNDIDSIINSSFINRKIILYTQPNQETRMYLVKGDKVAILDEQTDDTNQKWYFINYKSKKDINMWIKAEAVDVAE